MPNQETLFVKELIVVLSIIQEDREEAEEFLAVLDEDFLNVEGFVRVGDEDLG